MIDNNSTNSTILRFAWMDGMFFFIFIHHHHFRRVFWLISKKQNTIIILIIIMMMMMKKEIIQFCHYNCDDDDQDKIVIRFSKLCKNHEILEFWRRKKNFNNFHCVCVCVWPQCVKPKFGRMLSETEIYHSFGYHVTIKWNDE